MAKKKEIDQQDFEKLLLWLDSDKEIAGQKYETIRHRLIKIFNARGCFVADELADETIDRVIQKIDSLKDTYEGNPAIYFYGVGKKVLSEFFKKPLTEELSSTIIQEEIPEDDSERVKCLKICLQTLTEDQSSFILDYYEEEKQAKIENRKSLAAEIGTTNGILRMRAFRIRNILQKCMGKCLSKKIM